MITPFRAAPSWRVVAVRAAGADLFAGVADFGEWEAVAEIENRWNERTLGILGRLAQVPREQRAYGPGSVHLMVPFAFPNPSRFGAGAFGVLYAALDERTAILEVAHHRARFMRESGASPKEVLDHQVLALVLDADLEDLRGEAGARPELYDPDDYTVSQAFGAALRAAGRDGVAYLSVRNRGGECAAAFRPNAFSRCRPERAIQYFWDGASLWGPDGLCLRPE